MSGYKGYKEKVYSFQDGADILFITSNLAICINMLYDLVPGHFHFVLRDHSVYWRRLQNNRKIIQILPSGQVYTIRRFIVKKKFRPNDLRTKK